MSILKSYWVVCLTESASDHSLHDKSVHEYANASIYNDYVYISMKGFIAFMCVLDIVFSFLFFSVFKSCFCC